MTIKELEKVKQNIEDLRKKYNQILETGDQETFVNNLLFFEKPLEISLSLIRKTNGDFKGVGGFRSEEYQPKSYDEYRDKSEEDIIKYNMTNYIAAILIDYAHLQDYIDGYIHKLKEKNIQNKKDFLKEFFKSILPWSVAALPYIIKIIELLCSQ